MSEWLVTDADGAQLVVHLDSGVHFPPSARRGTGHWVSTALTADVGLPRVGEAFADLDVVERIERVR